MSDVSSQNSHTPRSESFADPGEELRWTCHPVRRKPLVSALVTVFIALVGVIVYHATGSQFFAVLALVILLASLAKFYFPTTYILTNQHITIKTTTQTLHKTWSQYRSCYPDKKGILLSPFAEPSRLENFRGLYLMFQDNRDELIAFVREHIGRESEPAPAASANDDSSTQTTTPEGDQPA